MNVVLVAEEAAGIQALREVLRSSHRLLAVATSDETQSGASVASAARADDVPVLPASNVVNPAFADWLRSRDVDLLLNVHSLQVIHPAAVGAPKIGSFNLHPGPLPGYAGLNAPSWAIFHGERRHAVTLHWMEPAIDTGPIAFEAWFDLSDDDTGLTVSVKCAREGIALVRRLLEVAGDDPSRIPATAQDLSQRRFFRRTDLPDEGRLQWGQPAARLAARVRGSDYAPFPSPWPPPVGRLGAHEVAILRVGLTGEPADARPGTVGRVLNGAVTVATADEWLLVYAVRVDGQPRPAGDVLPSGARFDDDGG